MRLLGMTRAKHGVDGIRLDEIAIYAAMHITSDDPCQLPASAASVPDFSRVD